MSDQGSERESSSLDTTLGATTTVGMETEVNTSPSESNVHFTTSEPGTDSDIDFQPGPPPPPPPRPPAAPLLPPQAPPAVPQPGVDPAVAALMQQMQQMQVLFREQANRHQEQVRRLELDADRHKQQVTLFEEKVQKLEGERVQRLEPRPQQVRPQVDAPVPGQAPDTASYNQYRANDRYLNRWILGLDGALPPLPEEELVPPGPRAAGPGPALDPASAAGRQHRPPPSMASTTNTSRLERAAARLEQSVVQLEDTEEARGERVWTTYTRQLKDDKKQLEDCLARAEDKGEVEDDTFQEVQRVLSRAVQADVWAAQQLDALDAKARQDKTESQQRNKYKFATFSGQAGDFQTFEENKTKIYQLYEGDSSQQLVQLAAVCSAEIAKGITRFCGTTDGPRRAWEWLTLKYGVSHLTLPVLLSKLKSNKPAKTSQDIPRVAELILGDLESVSAVSGPALTIPPDVMYAIFNQPRPAKIFPEWPS